MRHRLARAATLAIVLCAAAPATAGAFSKAIWGPGFVNGQSQFPIYQQLHASILEDDLAWRQVATSRPASAKNPNDPAYSWSPALDRDIAEAQRFHMRVLLQIITTPSWANGGRAYNWAPKRPEDLAAFATAAARRYPTVHLWMIWGEPTRRANFQPLVEAKPGTKLNHAQQVAPHLYARMLDASYGALKAVSKTNKVIGGCTFQTGGVSTLQWIQNLRLPNGHVPRMDLYGHNPFSIKAPSFSVPFSPYDQVQFSDLPRLADWIDRYLHERLSIFISEFTIPTAPDNEFNFYVDAPVAANWIKDALRLSRGWRRIYAFGWIHLYDDPPTTYGGLIDKHGDKKPGFDTFARG